MNAPTGIDRLARLRMRRPGIIPASVWNGLIDVIGMLVLLPGRGYRIKRVGLIGYTLDILLPSIPSPLYQFLGADASDTGAAKVTVGYGTYHGVQPTIDGTPLLPPIGTAVPALTLDDGARLVYITYYLEWNTAGVISRESMIGQISSTDSEAPPSDDIEPNDDGSGHAQIYDTLFGVRVTPPSGGGKYSVQIAQNIDESQELYICAAGGVIRQPIN